MKRALLLNLVLAVVLATGGAMGCKNKAKSPTVIPSRVGGAAGTGDDYGPQTAGGGGGGTVVIPPEIESDPLGAETTPLAPDGTFKDWVEHRDHFGSNTIYFDFDRSSIRAGDQAKLEEVGRYLLSNPGHGLRVEGNCDERGTEGYNLALGERRALAARDYLLTMGVPANQVITISYGESRPVSFGQTDADYQLCRRDDFVLLTPPPR